MKLKLHTGVSKRLNKSSPQMQEVENSDLWQMHLHKLQNFTHWKYDISPELTCAACQVVWHCDPEEYDNYPSVISNVSCVINEN